MAADAISDRRVSWVLAANMATQRHIGPDTLILVQFEYTIIESIFIEQTSN